MENMKIENLTVVEETDFAVIETEKCKIVIRVFFPHTQVIYETEKVPTLDEILNQHFVKTNYEKENTKIKLLEIEVQSENDGNRYCYEPARKRWYFIKKISTLKEDREEREKSNHRYSMAQKRFKERQIFKIRCLCFFITVTIICFFIGIRTENTIIGYTSAGAFGITLLSIDLVFSKIQFERTGGARYSRPEDYHTCHSPCVLTKECDKCDRRIV